MVFYLFFNLFHFSVYENSVDACAPVPLHSYAPVWEYPEKTTELSQVTEKLLSQNVVSRTPRHERGSNSQL